ncbi:MAG: terpene cyclase/mutase family protein [Planctomycetaceae bacterium]
MAAPRTAEEKRVDRSIVQALKYLAREQRPSGAWAIGRIGESTAATSLAVMAFLAAGHVPGEGPYGDAIEKGVQWVLDHQQPVDRTRGQETVMLVHRRSHGPMYSHGISTLMLAEVCGMLDKKQGKECRKALEKSIRLILKAQNIQKSYRHAGGWRYQASSRDSDLSVTGWQLLALRAAKDIGCDVPKANIEKAVTYVKNCRSRFGSGFGYQPSGGATATRTGTGILCLEVCGEHKCNETMRAADYLLRRPLQSRDSYFFYGVYYCTVGMFKVGGKHWKDTKNHLHNLLLNTQNGDGSWSPHGSESSHGRIYSTSMAVLALAVEYRYLPIYQR